MKIKAIITGSTGMIGEGVLHECLMSSEVENVLVINRKPCGITHAKLTEIIHKDFFDFTPIENSLKGYNACFFCLGVSSIGMKEDQYTKLTYTLTTHVAEKIGKQNSGLVFCYVSGAATDSSVKGRSMWARVKGKTENQLLRMPFKKAYMFRPAFIKPTSGLKNTLKAYRFLGWMYPVLKTLSPGYACTLKEIGLAMINSVNKGFEKQVLEVVDIVELAKR